MREFRVGAPLVNELNPRPFKNASGDPAYQRERAIERALGVCDYLSLNRPYAVTAAVPDCMPRPSELAGLVLTALARIRAPDPQGVSEEAFIPAHADR